MASGTMSVVARHLERLFHAGGVAGLTEGQLLQRFVTHRDEAAFEALVARHGPMVLWVCRQWLRDPNDVDDAFQATFLVLVRKAGSLRRSDLLGNWLYGVASKVAARSRSLAARRHATETPAAGFEAPAPEPSGGAARDVRADLHEEIQRLPDSYRAPVVLCYFEGLTHEQAAERLRWPVGTVKGRLSRARDLLRTRLTRRGLTLGSGAAVADLLAADAPAAVPAALFEHTVRAATGHAMTGALISIQALTLTEGVIHAMTITQLKTAFLSLALAGTVLTGAGVFAFQGSDGKGNTPAAEPAKAGSSAGDSGSPQPDGKKESAQEGGARIADLQKRSQMVEDAYFDGLLAERKQWSAHAVDRLFHWSRAIKEAHEYLSENDPDGLRDARRGHWARMKRLYDLTQKLSGPDQRQIADAGRSSLQSADRELADFRPGTKTGAPTAASKAAVPPTPATPEGQMASMMMRMMAGSGGGGGGGMMGASRGGVDNRTASKAMMGANRGGVDNRTASKAMMAGMMMGGVGDTGKQNRMREWIAASAPQVAAHDKSPMMKVIQKKLDEPISMNFSNETPFEDILKYIRQATQGPNDAGLPIYVDPVGLKEAEKTMTSPVSIDLEGVPLKTTLRLILKQMGLAYCVKDGLVIISSVEGIHQELMESARAEEEAQTNTPG